MNMGITVIWSVKKIVAGLDAVLNKQIPWGIYVPRLIFIWGVKNG